MKNPPSPRRCNPKPKPASKKRIIALYFEAKKLVLLGMGEDEVF